MHKYAATRNQPRVSFLGAVCLEVFCLFVNYNFSLWMCVGAGYNMGMLSEDNVVESLCFFHLYVGPRGQAQVTRLA